MKYTSRADLLIAAGESIKMQKNYGIRPVFKGCYDARTGPLAEVFPIEEMGWCIPSCEIEFPLAVIDDRAVFLGDELYYGDSGLQTFIADKMFPEKWSWNPPKPKTVMVELLREEAEDILNCTKTDGPLHIAILKSLEQQ